MSFTSIGIGIEAIVAYKGFVGIGDMKADAVEEFDSGGRISKLRFFSFIISIITVMIGLTVVKKYFKSLFFYFGFNDVVEGTVLAELTRRRSQTLRSSSMI